MPQKPFEYKIVRLNKPIGPYEVGDILIVTPYQWMKIWSTERGYLLHGVKAVLILGQNEDTWDVLNIDGVDQIEEYYPQKAIEDLNRLSKASGKT